MRQAHQQPSLLEDILTFTKQCVLIFSRDGVCKSAWGSNPLSTDSARRTMLELRLSQLVATEDLALVRKSFELAVETELPQFLVVETRAKGALKLVEIIFYPLRQSNSTQVAACFRDAHWPRQVRARDLEAATNFANLTQAAKIGTFTIDLNKAQVSVCENYRRIFEIAEHNLRGKDLLLKFYLAEEVRIIEQGLERCSLFLEPFRTHVHAVGASGKRLFLEFFAEPQQNDLGVVHQIHGFVQDIERFEKLTNSAPPSP